MSAPDRLAAYLERLRLDAPPSPDADGLARVQAAHRRAIAFENLDILLRRPIRIDSDSVFDKLVTRRRGGYCFEQNRLLADMLAALGLPNRPLLARVQMRLAPGEIPPRTHMLLLLELDGEPWIADAGFGGSFAPPLPLRDGASAATEDGARHRLRRIGQPGDLTGEWLLERAGSPSAMDERALFTDEWQPQYAFDLAPVSPIDLELSNHWTATRPDTRFTTLHIASIVLPDGFTALMDRMLTQVRGSVSEKRELTGPADYSTALADLFGLSVSADEVAALPLFASAAP